jgi:hypothetical protein
MLLMDWKRLRLPSSQPCRSERQRCRKRDVLRNIMTFLREVRVIRQIVQMKICCGRKKNGTVISSRRRAPVRTRRFPSESSGRDPDLGVRGAVAADHVFLKTEVPVRKTEVTDPRVTDPREADPKALAMTIHLVPPRDSGTVRRPPQDLMLQPATPLHGLNVIAVQLHGQSDPAATEVQTSFLRPPAMPQNNSKNQQTAKPGHPANVEGDQDADVHQNHPLLKPSHHRNTGTRKRLRQLNAPAPDNRPSRLRTDATEISRTEGLRLRPFRMNQLHPTAVKPILETAYWMHLTVLLTTAR